MCLSYFAQGHNAVMPVTPETSTFRSRVKHSTTEPLCSPFPVFEVEVQILSFLVLAAILFSERNDLCNFGRENYVKII